MMMRIIITSPAMRTIFALLLLIFLSNDCLSFQSISIPRNSIFMSRALKAMMPRNPDLLTRKDSCVVLTSGVVGNEPKEYYMYNGHYRLLFSLGVSGHFHPLFDLEKDKASETMWLPCEVFDEVAKDNIESFRKGSKIHLVGSLLFNKWIDKNNGEERKQFRFRIKKVLSELQFKKMNTFLEYEDLMISDHSKLLQPRPPQKLNYPQEKIQMQEPEEYNQNILPPTIKRSKRMMKTKSSQHESETSTPSKELPLEIETSNFVEMSLPIIETPAPVIPRFLPVAPSSIPPMSSPPTVQSPAMLAASSSDSLTVSVQLDGPDTSQINGERERDATNNPWNREDSWDNVEREIRESRVKNKATNKFI